jgi:hypothetical protein
MFKKKLVKGAAAIDRALFGELPRGGCCGCGKPTDVVDILPDARHPYTESYCRPCFLAAPTLQALPHRWR